MSAPRSPVSEALAEAAEWRLLGLLLERPRAGWWEEVASLACEARNPELRAAADETARATEEGYLAALGPGGAVSPREVAYIGMEDPARVIADLHALYQAFAYRPAAEDPPDHVALQAGFAGYLKLKEAYARAKGDEAAAETTAQALRRFVESHLRRFAGPLARRLEAAGSGHLLQAARLLVGRVGEAIEPLPVLTDDGGSAMCCGGEEGIQQ